MNVDDEVRTVLDQALTKAYLEVAAVQRRHLVAALNEMYWLGCGDGRPSPVVTRKEDLHISHSGYADRKPVVRVADRRSGQVLLQLSPEHAHLAGQALTATAIQTVDLEAQVRAGQAEQGGPAR